MVRVFGVMKLINVRVDLDSAYGCNFLMRDTGCELKNFSPRVTAYDYVLIAQKVKYSESLT